MMMNGLIILTSVTMSPVTHGCKKPKIALGSVAGPSSSGYELAVTSQTGSATRLARARHACGIFLKKSLSTCKVVDDLDPYPTNVPYIRGTFDNCTSSLR
jgi:hypothetical protein